MRPESSETQQKHRRLEDISHRSSTRICQHRNSWNARGHCYLLVITDHFTKLVCTVRLRGVFAGEVAKQFVKHWLFLHGHPLKLIADKGHQFTSKAFEDVCRIFNEQNVFTTTEYPQNNGKGERVNRKILSGLRAYISYHPRDWDLYSFELTYAFNCQPQISTALATFQIALSNPPGSPAMQKKLSSRLERTECNKSGSFGPR